MAEAAVPAAPESAPWTPSHSPWLITVAVLLATFMEVLDTSIANVSLPHIAGSLSATTEEATWVLTSYLVSNAIILSAAGWLSRYFGRKRYLLYSVLLFTASSALCGLAQSLGFLIVARILQGLGGGGLQPVAQAILLESFPHEKRGAAMAAYGMGIVVAPIIGPTLGGWITDSYSWRWIFYINIPIGILGIFLQQMFLEDPPYMKKTRGLKIDYVGFGLMALGIGLLQIILDKGQQADWFESSWIRWSSLVTAALLVSFVVWELREKEPIVNLRVLSNRNFAIGTTLMALLGAVLYGSTVILPIFMQALLRYTAFLSGLAMTPRGIGSFFSMIIIGRLVQKVDNRWLIVVGFCGIASTCWILSRLNLDVTQSDIIWPLVLNGLSMGFVFVPMTTESMATLKQQQIYQATGLYSLMRNIGAGVGISILVTMQSRWTQVHHALLSARMSPYDPAFRMQTERMAGILGGQGGVAPGQAGPMAYGTLYGELMRQASLLSFMDGFRWLAVVCVACMPLVFLFKKAKAGHGPMMVD